MRALGLRYVKGDIITAGPDGVPKIERLLFAFRCHHPLEVLERTEPDGPNGRASAPGSPPRLTSWRCCGPSAPAILASEVEAEAGHIAFRQSLLVKSQDAERFASYDNLTSDVRVGVLRGTTGEAQLLRITGIANGDARRRA